MCQALAFRPRERHAPTDAAHDHPDAARSEVLYEVADHIATITLNAPERMNTISGRCSASSRDRLLEADRDRDVRCIVLTGAGRAFCAGLDLAAQMAGPKGGARQPGRPVVVHRRVRPPRRPADRAAQPRHADDLRAERRRRRLRPRPRARLRHPHRRRDGQAQPRASPSAASCPRAAARGCCPAWSATPRRPRSPSPGRTLTADEALELGLVNRVVPADDLAEAGARLRRRDRRQRAARRAGDQADDARGRDRDVRAERAPRLPAAAAAVPHRRLPRGRRRLHGEAPAQVPRPLSRRRSDDRDLAARGLATTRAIRRYRDDPIPDADLATILWHAGRAPSRIEPPAVPVPRAARRTERDRGQGAARPGVPRRAGAQARVGRRRTDPSPRLADSMQHYVDHFEQMPVVVLVCLERYRAPSPVRGRVGVPGLPEPAARGPCPRLRRGDDDVAPGVEPELRDAARHPRRSRAVGLHHASACPRASRTAEAPSRSAEITFDDTVAAGSDPTGV